MKLATVLISALSITCVTAGTTRGGNKERQPLGSHSLSRWLMGSNSGDNGSGKDECDVCFEDKPDIIRLKYTQASATSVLHTGNNIPNNPPVCQSSTDYGASNSVTYNGKTVDVVDGTMIEIDRSAGAWTVFSFGSGPSCQIHTSCSWPLVGGDIIGPFEVVAPDFCQPRPEGECVICDKADSNNDSRPLSLTIQYFSGAGQNSNFQVEEKHASCFASPDDPYPDDTTIVARDKNGIIEIFENVKNGAILVLNAPSRNDEQPRFEANTIWEIAGWTGGGQNSDFPGADTCHFHTSCSAPLVVGDQIGAFKLLAGNDCDVLPCVTVEKLEYECGEDITVTWDFAFSPPTTFVPYNGLQGPAVDTTTYPTSLFPNGLPDDQIGIWPCGLNLEYSEPTKETDTTFWIKKPEVWAWTCAEYGESAADCDGIPKAAGAITFKDPEPLYVEQSGSAGFPIAPFYKDAAKTEVNECFQVILIRGRAVSPPPYIPVCYSQEFTIKAGSSSDCQIRASTVSFPLEQDQ